MNSEEAQKIADSKTLATGELWVVEVRFDANGTYSEYWPIRAKDIPGYVGARTEITGNG